MVENNSHSLSKTYDSLVASKKIFEQQITWLHNQYNSLHTHGYLDDSNYLRLKKDETLNNFIKQSESLLYKIHNQIAHSHIADLEKIKNDIRTVEIIYYIFNDAFFNKSETLRITYHYIAKISQKESIQAELILLEKTKNELEVMLPKLNQIDKKRIEKLLYSKNIMNDQDTVEKLSAILTLIQSNSDIYDFLEAADTAVKFIHKEQKELIDTLNRIKELNPDLN